MPDLANGDVETLLQLVLMDGFELESELTQEFLEEGRQNEERKAALRALETAAKKQRSETTWQLVLELALTAEKDLRQPRRGFRL